MRRGEPFPDRVMKEPSGRAAERRGTFDPERGPPRRPNFTAPHIDRFFLVGCSPYMFLQGTKSELLPPLNRDGYRLERDPGLKAQWDALPQAEKDAFGFERETQDFLQRCVDEMDRRIREEQETLSVAGSTDLVDKTSGFAFPADCKAEQMGELQGSKHHAAWMGLRDILKRLKERGFPEIGTGEPMYGVKGGRVPGHPADTGDDAPEERRGGAGLTAADGPVWRPPSADRDDDLDSERRERRDDERDRGRRDWERGRDRGGADRRDLGRDRERERDRHDDRGDRDRRCSDAQPCRSRRPTGCLRLHPHDQPRMTSPALALAGATATSGAATGTGAATEGRLGAGRPRRSARAPRAASARSPCTTRTTRLAFCATNRRRRAGRRRARRGEAGTIRAAENSGRFRLFRASRCLNSCWPGEYLQTVSYAWRADDILGRAVLGLR